MLCNPYNEGLRPFQNSLKLCPSLIVENNWKGGEKQSGDGAAGLQCKHFAENRELQLLHCRCIEDALWEFCCRQGRLPASRSSIQPATAASGHFVTSKSKISRCGGLEFSAANDARDFSAIHERVQ